MRKSKRVTMDVAGTPVEVTLLELRVRDVTDMYERVTAEMDMAALLEMAGEFQARFMEGIGLDDLLGMAPSELEFLWEEWKEVNSSFFRLAKLLGLTDLLRQFKDALTRDLCALSLHSLSEGMELSSGSMDGSAFS